MTGFPAFQMLAVSAFPGVHSKTIGLTRRPVSRWRDPGAFVSAAAAHEIIKRKLEIVIARNQLKADHASPRERSSPVMRYAREGGYRASGLDWLLIEACLWRPGVKSPASRSATNLVVGFATLRLQQPVQRFKAARNHLIIQTGGSPRSALPGAILRCHRRPHFQTISNPVCRWIDTYRTTGGRARIAHSARRDLRIELKYS